ncbi:MAG: hypothetical protein RLZZ324_548 [Candidatus Parcubacteria bacterium]|jgi:hypothetical protein
MQRLSRPWFKNKRYGYGWYPATWEGWTVMAVWFAVFVAILRNVDAASHSASDTLLGVSLPILASVVVLIIIAALTGEKPEWRWDGKPMHAPEKPQGSAPNNDRSNP